MYKQFNEIEEFNKYIHNKEDDGKKCNLYHLIIFLSPTSEDYLINSSPYFSTYLENSYYYDSSIRFPSCVCDFCSIFTQADNFDESYLDDIDLDNKDIHCKNCGDSIDLSFISNSPLRLVTYLNQVRTINSNGPLFYCLICNKYIDWVCLSLFHQLELKDWQKFSIRYLTQHNDIDYNEEEFQLDEKDMEYQT